MINEGRLPPELLLILLPMPLAFWIGDSLNEILLLVYISWLVVIVEVLNSAVEAVVIIGSEHHGTLRPRQGSEFAAVFAWPSMFWCRVPWWAHHWAGGRFARATFRQTASVITTGFLLRRIGFISAGSGHDGAIDLFETGQGLLAVSVSTSMTT